MKRPDLTLPAQPLAHGFLALAGQSPFRQGLALELLAGHARWDALLLLAHELQQCAGPAAVHELLLPEEGLPFLYRASRCAKALVDTLDALLALGGMPHSDAEVVARARQPAEWERDTFPVTPPSLQQWLDAGLRWAVGSGDLARVTWWLQQGSDLHHQDADGRNAIQAARSAPMLDWLLSQGVPVDGDRRWDGRASHTLLRNGNYAGLQCLARHGVDLGELGWSPLHRLIILGSANDLAAALEGPQRRALLGQLEAQDSWKRRPAMHAAYQGAVDKLVLLCGAGANLHVLWRGYPLMHWIVESGEPAALRWWLGQPGVDPEAPMGELGDTPLLAAVEKDALLLAEILLQAGADPNRYNSNSSCPMNSARSRPMLELLAAYGGSVEEMGQRGPRVWLGQPLQDERERPWLVTCTPKEFLSSREPREGRTNGEEITTAFHVAMLESCDSAYGAFHALGRDQDFGDTAWAHVWNADRFGQSLTGLPDGRWVQIGGEHEDSYDPDFFIFSDVIVHTAPTGPDGAWNRQVFAYPKSVFPPTDFHSATLVGEQIVVIGCLGYLEQRRPGHTPVHVLDTRSLQMRPLHCTGETPGWIYQHRATLVERDVIEVGGGERWLGSPAEEGGDRLSEKLPGRWRLDLTRQQWHKVPPASP